MSLPLPPKWDTKICHSSRSNNSFFLIFETIKYINLIYEYLIVSYNFFSFKKAIFSTNLTKTGKKLTEYVTSGCLIGEALQMEF